MGGAVPQGEDIAAGVTVRYGGGVVPLAIRTDVINFDEVLRMKGDEMKIKLIRNRLWLCVPIAIADILDTTFTFLGQPDEYWRGAYHFVNEFNPLAHWVMELNPVGLAIYEILDFLMVSTLIIVSPLIIAKILSGFWTIGSAIGLYGWLTGPFHITYWIANLVILILAAILVHAYDKASKGVQATFRN